MRQRGSCEFYEKFKVLEMHEFEQYFLFRFVPKRVLPFGFFPVIFQPSAHACVIRSVSVDCFRLFVS